MLKKPTYTDSTSKTSLRYQGHVFQQKTRAIILLIMKNILNFPQ